MSLLWNAIAAPLVWPVLCTNCASLEMDLRKFWLRALGPPAPVCGPGERGEGQRGAGVASWHASRWAGPIPTSPADPLRGVGAMRARYVTKAAELVSLVVGMLV